MNETLTLQQNNGTLNLGPALERIAGWLGPDPVLPLPECRIVIYKSARVLSLYTCDRKVKEYMFALGREPKGHKQWRGDSRTPVGQYYVCTRNHLSRYHLFLGFNYPNSRDAAGARALGMIDDDLVAELNEAEINRRRPHWDTPLGGAIGIHGGGRASDWTQGCLAVENEDIEEIWLAVPLWTPVLIRE